MTNYKVGDKFNASDFNTAADDCTAATSKLGFSAYCNLTKDHEGPHVAANSDLVVVETWQ